MDLWVTEHFLDRSSLGFRVKEVLYQGQSEFQKIDLVDTVAMGRMLLLDGYVMTTERDEFIYHEMIAHVPLLAHPEPKQVLVIGGGDGGTVREVLRHPSVERVVLCEIDGEVIEVCKKYLPAIAGELDDPRVEIRVGDGAAYVAGQENTFDAILVDSTDPIGPGEKLFTEDFYRNVRKALTDNGVMACQSESPMSVPDECLHIHGMLKKVFSMVQPYFAAVPTYPGAHWTWTFCSKSGLRPEQGLENPLARQLEQVTRYFNRGTHQGALCLPNYMLDLYGMRREAPVC